MYYATQDYSDGTINENANIVAFKTMDEVREYLLKPYADDLKNPIIAPGRFSDCWIKAANYSKKYTDVSPFKPSMIQVQGPGTHPGLSGYTWLTPRPDVYIVTSYDVDEES
jgi:hypothetical protein